MKIDAKNTAKHQPSLAENVWDLSKIALTSWAILTSGCAHELTKAEIAVLPQPSANLIIKNPTLWENKDVVLKGNLEFLPDLTLITSRATTDIKLSFTERYNPTKSTPPYVCVELFYNLKSTDSDGNENILLVKHKTEKTANQVEYKVGDFKRILPEGEVSIAGTIRKESKGKDAKGNHYVQYKAMAETE